MAELRRVFSVVAALLLALATTALAAGPARAETPAGAAAVAVAADKQEEEAADSPRASMRSYADLCARGRYDEAARYLDLPPGTHKRGPDLARKLYVVLSERLPIRPDLLSPASKGREADGLAAGTEELGKIEWGRGRVVAVRLVKHASHAPEDEARWVFAQSTVQSVDQIYASLKGSWIRDHVPAPLTSQGPFALYYWQWLALPILAALCVVLGRLLAYLSVVVATRLTRKWSVSARFLQRLRRPMTVGWAVAAFALTLPDLGLTVRADELLERVLRALAYLAFFWALFRATSLGGAEVARADWARAKPGVRSLASVGVKLGKVVVASLALMVALSELGYPVTSVVAGLGIGGVALALAAQKTVENLFGSISILADQPFVVGDTIRVDTVEGTVESIGLRSTRLRTVDRTLVVIPNGKLADMRIESLGARDRIRFSVKLSVARDATVAQLRGIVAAVRRRLESHEKVRKEDVFVRLTGLGEQSYDIDVGAPVDTLDLAEFARVREELLCACIEEVQSNGAALAVPTRRLVDRPRAEAGPPS